MYFHLTQRELRLSCIQKAETDSLPVGTTKWFQLMKTDGNYVWTWPCSGSNLGRLIQWREHSICEKKHQMSTYCVAHLRGHSKMVCIHYSADELRAPTWNFPSFVFRDFPRNCPTSRCRPAVVHSRPYSGGSFAQCTTVATDTKWQTTFLHRAHTCFDW